MKKDYGKKILIDRILKYGNNFYKPEKPLEKMNFKELSDFVSAFHAIGYEKSAYDNASYEEVKKIKDLLIIEVNRRLESKGLLEIFNFVYSNRNKKEDYFAYNGDNRYEVFITACFSDEYKGTLKRTFEINTLLQKYNITFEVYKEICGLEKKYYSVSDDENNQINVKLNKLFG